MAYLIPLVLVVLVVGGFATFLVMNAARKSDTEDARDPGADENPLGIIGSDEGSPLGDTREHAGEQDQEGRTVADQDADAHGGTGRPRFEHGTSDKPPAEVGPPVVGGEGEGERRLD